MDAFDLQRIVAALVSRSGTGVCRFSPHELAMAPVEKLRISTDKRGDVFLDFKDQSTPDEDTWPIDE